MAIDDIEGSVPGTVTNWIEGLRAGDEEAARLLWQRYFVRLTALARVRLRAAPRRAADEEDVALSAFDSFCRGAEQGKFPELLDRDNLWRLLVVITARKALGFIKRQGRQKRGGGAVLDEAALDTPGAADADRGLDRVIGREPTPEFAVQVADELQGLLRLLYDDELKSVAQWKMEGFSNKEIAARTGRSLRSVERMLQVIRRVWTEGRSDEG
jgi:DNA-directed RNA polymerase specialized sigma24 family protein